MSSSLILQSSECLFIFLSLRNNSIRKVELKSSVVVLVYLTFLIHFEDLLTLLSYLNISKIRLL